MSCPRRDNRWVVLILGFALGLSGLEASSQTAPNEGAPSAAFVGNKKSKVLHLTTCGSARRLSEANKVELSDFKAALAQGYKPCKICHPENAAAGQGARPPQIAQATTRRGGAAPPPVASLEPAARDDGKLKFSRDIAPILVGNCTGCHNAEQKRGKFDLSTFQKMMAGSQSGEVIVPGKPEESLLVELVTERKMPRGNNRRLSDDAIAKITQWVKEGALLDAGKDPTASIDKIAPSPEEMRRAALVKLSPEERDAHLKEVALDRWKKASSKAEPEMTSGKDFLLFGNLPESRAKAILKTLEDQRTRLGTLLGTELAAALTGPEKISVYVFNEPTTYAEFVRGVEMREIEPGDEAHGKLDVESPYLAAVDPLGGGEEPAATSPSRRSSRTKPQEEEDSAGRTLAGLLSEQLGTAVSSAAGQAPSWLSSGLGAYLAVQVEPRSDYYRRLRAETLQQYQLGWVAKATEVLGDQSGPDTLRAVGFSLFEWLGSSFRQQFPYFVREMIKDPKTLDEVIHQCWGPQVTRDQFLAVWGRWVAARYHVGTRRR